jgi:hydroxyacylglutathione hydrolase
MKFEQITAEGLSHHSYFVASAGKAAVIDPRRDIDVYLDFAKRYDVAITHIFETHRHEDFVVGSRELAACTGASIYHGSQLDFGYGTAVSTGATFRVGLLRLGVIHTPGHTDESLSITMTDTAVSDQMLMVFTGDTIFAGDVGRIDLYGEEEADRLATQLYDSLMTHILALPDHVILCPAHGAGSVCGGAIGDLPLTTIGYEKKTNALLALGREAFVQHMRAEQLYRPPYFRRMEVFNKDGPPLLHHLPHLTALSATELQEQKQDIQLVDIRKPAGFAAGHIPGSLNIWRGGLASFIGWFLVYDRRIVLIDDYNLRLDQAVRPFIRLGYDQVTGYLSEGISAWFRAGKPVAHIDFWDIDQLQAQLGDDALFVLDARDNRAWQKGHIPHATHVYAGLVPEQMDSIPRDHRIVIYCDGGYKTGVVASYLKQQGYQHVTELAGGIAAWRTAGYPLEQ